jgi:hypothetical protein
MKSEGGSTVEAIHCVEIAYKNNPQPTLLRECDFCRPCGVSHDQLLGKLLGDRYHVDAASNLV